MNKNIYIYILLSIVILSGCRSTSNTSSQQENPEVQSVTNSISVITSHYIDWEEAGISGKISMDRLPISPTTKIYMKKGEEIIISLRVPLLGEVGRLEIDKKNIYAFNKLKNVYTQEDISLLFDKFNLSVDNIQDMLLARVFLLGKGTLTNKHSKLIEKHEDASEPDAWYLIPKDLPEQLNYGFKTTNKGILSLTIFESQANEIEAYLKYSPIENGYSITANLDFRGKNLNSNLSYSTIDWSPTKIEKLSISNNWKKVNISDFLKSF